MKVAIASGQFLLRCLDQRQQDVLILEKKKTLIGSHEQCDFRLSDNSVSSYHAFLCAKGEGFMVKDLYSEAGVFVNGTRVEEAFVSSGDILTLGTMSFSIDALEDAVPLYDSDQMIKPLEILSSVELPSREGLFFIDGEYCDIQFDESQFRPLTSLPNLGFKGDFIDLDQSDEPLNITHSVKDKRLEIITYMNGLMLDVSYVDLKNGHYWLDADKKGRFHIPFHSTNRTKLFSIENGELRFYPTDVVAPSIAWDEVNLSEALFLTRGAEQISLRLVDQAVGWQGVPLFYRDRDFFKQGSKVFAGVFLPLLILLFIGVDRPAEVKEEIAVVYTLPTKMEKPAEALEKSEVKAEELTSKTENSGHKENQQKSEKVEFAAASQTKQVMARAQAPAAAPSQPVPTSPVKAYEFKSSVAMGSLVADAPKLNTEGAGKSALKDSSFNAGTSDDGQLMAGADVGISKFNGSDKKGSGAASYGSRGLASKSGFDSSYLEPKTVVLGSMDPELLRKILREYIPQFRHCYQQELIVNSEKIKGVIDLNFTIASSGKVSKYQIKTKDAQFSQKGVGCMGQVLSVIDFPKPKGGGFVDVRQPLNFFAETEKI
jgi:hypothetical protein